MSQAKFNVVSGTVEMSASDKNSEPESNNTITNRVVKFAKDSPSEIETAEYIRDMIKELSSLAASADLVFLNYLLDVAYEEARIRSRSREEKTFL